MASLRARLIAVLLVVAALGLLALAGITYTEQRSFLLERVDQQLGGPPGDYGDADDHRPPGGGGPDFGIPAGTYGERRDASGRVLTRAQLLDHVWDYDFGGDARVLETYISYLRKKLDAHGPALIHTVRGVGYALRQPRT